MRYQTAPCPAPPRPRILTDYTFSTQPTGAGMIRRPPQTVNSGPAPLGTAVRAILQDDPLGCQRVADTVRFLEVLVLARLEAPGDPFVYGSLFEAGRGPRNRPVATRAVGALAHAAGGRGGCGAYGGRRADCGPGQPRRGCHRRMGRPAPRGAQEQGLQGSGPYPRHAGSPGGHPGGSPGRPYRVA